MRKIAKPKKRVAEPAAAVARALDELVLLAVLELPKVAYELSELLRAAERKGMAKAELSPLWDGLQTFARELPGAIDKLFEAGRRFPQQEAVDGKEKSDAG